MKAGGPDVLAQTARSNVVAGLSQLVEQLGGDEMYLPDIGREGRTTRQISVADVRSGMRVLFDTAPGDQRD